jgi:hypothetical protein
LIVAAIQVCKGSRYRLCEREKQRVVPNKMQRRESRDKERDENLRFRIREVWNSQLRNPRVFLIF